MKTRNRNNKQPTIRESSSAGGDGSMSPAGAGAGASVSFPPSPTAAMSPTKQATRLTKMIAKPTATNADDDDDQILRYDFLLYSSQLLRDVYTNVCYMLPFLFVFQGFL
jgi:hypothetical protein